MSSIAIVWRTIRGHRPMGRMWPLPYCTPIGGRNICALWPLAQLLLSTNRRPAASAGTRWPHLCPHNSHPVRWTYSVRADTTNHWRTRPYYCCRWTIPDCHMWALRVRETWRNVAPHRAADNKCVSRTNRCVATIFRCRQPNTVAPYPIVRQRDNICSQRWCLVAARHSRCPTNRLILSPKWWHSMNVDGDRRSPTTSICYVSLAGAFFVFFSFSLFCWANEFNLPMTLSETKLRGNVVLFQALHNIIMVYFIECIRLSCNTKL